MFKYLFISLFFVPLLSYGQFYSVCNRTTAVKEAIMEKVYEVSPEIECQDDDLWAVLFPKILILDLEAEGITSLKPGDFSGLSELVTLSLESNELTALPPNIFAGLSSLQILSIGSNNLTTLPPSAFAGLSSLKLLSLVANNLTSLPPNIFDGLSSLKQLHLSNSVLDDEETRQYLESYAKNNDVTVNMHP